MAAKYFTGKPCKRGHVSERFVSTRNCVECVRENARKVNMTESQIAAKRVRDAAWASVNAVQVRVNWAKHYAKNFKQLAAKSLFQYHMRRRRVPAWADKKAIAAFYAACPIGYEVDHIVPLQGELVCGLHVENNLQYLTVLQNRQKGNSFTS